MAQVALAPEVGEDLERILEHLQAHETADAAERLDEIIGALDILEQHPLIGRPVRGGLRGAVIGRRSRGYVALYRYAPELQAVFVLAIRSQLEAGYSRD
jgi:plasmid stabilization system protein ParE